MMRREQLMHLSVESRLRDLSDGAEETIAYTTRARLSIDDASGQYTLLFTEPIEEGRPHIRSRMTFVCGSDTLCLSRHGSVRQEMRFRLKESTTTAYRMEEGTWEMQIETAQLAIALNETGGEISLAYALHFGGMTREVTMTVRGTPCEKGER